jgi:hypothetical protein
MREEGIEIGDATRAAWMKRLIIVEKPDIFGADFQRLPHDAITRARHDAGHSEKHTGIRALFHERMQGYIEGAIPAFER